MAQLGNAQLERTQPRVEATIAIAVTVIEPIAGALVPAGTDQPLDIGFHQDLQHRLRYGSQKIAIAALLQQLGQRHSLLGHRVLGQLGVKRCNSTLAGPPGDHLSLTRAPGSKYWGIPPDVRLPLNFHHQGGR